MLRLAAPATASMLLTLGFNLTDLYWVGRLGTDALAAVGASAFGYWILTGVAHVASVGTVARTARAVGAGDAALARRAAATGLVLSLLLAVVAAVGLPILPAAFRAQGLTPDVVSGAVTYLGTVLIGFAAISGFIAVEAIFRGAGDTVTPMLLTAGFVLLNVALDPLLMFGWGPIPPLGLAGVAAATVLTNALGLLVGLVLLTRRGLLPTWGSGWPRLAELLATGRIGLPIASSEIFFSLVYVALVPMLAPFGPAPVAALGIGHKIEGVAYFICVGLSAATATLVGQHLGAGQVRRAARAAWLATGIGAAAMGVVIVVLWTVPAWLIGLFTTDPEVIAVGTAYLRIVSLCLPFQAAELILEGAFSGASDTLPPLVIAAPLTLLRLPLAAALIALGWGPNGVWLAIAATAVLKGIVAALWFRRNRWARHSRLAAR